MVYAAIDIHKRVLQAAVLDSESGQLEDERFSGREGLAEWTTRWRGRVQAVAIEATTGWRWVARELQAAGFDVRLVDPGQARALQGRTRRAKTDRLDARWLVQLLARQLVPESWLPPEQIQQLRDRTRLRKALVEDKTRWAQRLHALLTQEGWPCQRERLLTQAGRRWARALALPQPARRQLETILTLIELLEAELAPLEAELRRFARSDPRCRVLESVYGVGPILACHLLAEIGQASRFRRARQLVRASGLDPQVRQSGERASGGGRLSKQGSPQLRWALVQAAQNAERRRSPDRELFQRASARAGARRARLTVARKIGRRCFHRLRELELAT